MERESSLFFFFVVVQSLSGVRFFGTPRTEACLLIGKDPDTGRDWGQEEKGTTEDEMAG